MITRHVEPAAFTSSPAVPFVLLEDLAALIQSQSDPGLGQVWPAAGVGLASDGVR